MSKRPSVPVGDEEESDHEAPPKKWFVLQAGNENGGYISSSSSSYRFCRDCGNRAKKECEFVKCRRCCKARGHDCPTHVIGTWRSTSSGHHGGCFSRGGRGNEQRFLPLGEKSRRIENERDSARESMTAATLSANSSTSGYDLEFRCPIDDAWYSVRAIFDGRRKELRVKFESFDDGEDFVVEAEGFTTLGELEEFIARFRPVSHQLQDWECLEVTQGRLVCVSHSDGGNDNRFYDAIIDEVMHNEHEVVNGEEVCECVFVVVWKHGPVKYQMHEKKIENICIVQTVSELDPAVANFLEVATQAIEGGASLKAPPSSPSTLDFPPKERKGNQRSAKRMRSMKGDAGFNVGTQEGLDASSLPFLETSGDDDADMMGGRYALLVDNLEKGISPSAIVQFIHRETSVLVEAHISSSFSYETYTKAAIVACSEQKLELVCNFLDNPAHFVTSWTGRPLVVTEKRLPLSTYGIEGLTNYTQSKKWLLGSKEKEERGLKIVRRGSEEYSRAEQRKGLFMKFAEQLNLLFQTLSKTEIEIQQHSSAAI